MSYRMKYFGTRKINAIKAVRVVCNVGLKEAKDAVESADGFLVSGTQVAAIMGDYLSQKQSNIVTTTAFDWAVEDWDVRKPVDFRGGEPRMDLVMAHTRGMD